MIRKECPVKRFLSVFLSFALLLGLSQFLCPGLAAQAANSKLIAITYDDGPGYYTEDLLDGLKARGVKATFFMLGSNAARYSSTVSRVYREGHQIANHSYDHPDLTTLSANGVRGQIQRTNALLDKACGKGSRYLVRAPYGSVNSTVFQSVGAPLVLWSVDPLDWKYRNAETVKSNILRQAHDGADILVHDIHSTTIPGSLAAIDVLKSRGYEFVTVSELFRRRGKSMSNGVQYRSCPPNGTDLGPVKAPSVTVQPEGDKLRVTLAAQAGASIYYSTDGSSLNQSSSRYQGSFLISVPCTLRACASFHMNGSRSETVEQVFTQPPVQEPRIQVEDGLLRLASATSGATLSYILQDEEVQTYTGPVPIEPGTEISAWARKEGWLTSPKVRASYSPRGNLFLDVFPSQWFYEAMDRAVSSGYMGGVGNNHFAPAAPITRGQLAVLLYRCGGDAPSPETVDSLPFSDVPLDAYYREAVAWAYEAGIVGGAGENRFQPDRSVTRQEMAKMFAGYLRNQGALPADTAGAADGYSDRGKIDGWALESVEQVTALGLLSGQGGSFLPKETSTRAQAAAVLMRLADYLNRT